MRDSDTDGDIGTEADLICEALVREIGRAQHWTAAQEAWDALLHVRRMHKDLSAEAAYLAEPKETGDG